MTAAAAAPLLPATAIIRHHTHAHTHARTQTRTHTHTHTHTHTRAYTRKASLFKTRRLIHPCVATVIFDPSRDQQAALKGWVLVPPPNSAFPGSRLTSPTAPPSSHREYPPPFTPAESAAVVSTHSSSGPSPAEPPVCAPSSAPDSSSTGQAACSSRGPQSSPSLPPPASELQACTRDDSCVAPQMHGRGRSISLASFLAPCMAAQLSHQVGEEILVRARIEWIGVLAPTVTNPSVRSKAALTHSFAYPPGA